MINLKLKFAVTLALSLLTVAAFAQSLWELGGNDGILPNPVNATNNILGTSVGTNLPIRFATNGVQRMWLTESGWLGLNTANPQMMFHVSEGVYYPLGPPVTNLR